jgi:hypothetical protein
MSKECIELLVCQPKESECKRANNGLSNKNKGNENPKQRYHPIVFNDNRGQIGCVEVGPRRECQYGGSRGRSEVVGSTKN